MNLGATGGSVARAISLKLLHGCTVRTVTSSPFFSTHPCASQLAAQIASTEEGERRLSKAISLWETEKASHLMLSKRLVAKCNEVQVRREERIPQLNRKVSCCRRDSPHGRWEGGTGDRGQGGLFAPGSGRISRSGERHGAVPTASIRGLFSVCHRLSSASAD